MKGITKKIISILSILIVGGISVKYIVESNKFNKILTSTLQKTIGLNIDVDNISIISFNKIQLDNLEVYNQDKELILKAKKSVADFNIFLPTRVRDINIYDADIYVKRYKGGKLNVDNIVDKSEKTDEVSTGHTNNIQNIWIHNSTVHYHEYSFKNEIYKKVTDINGLFKSYNNVERMELEIEGKSIGANTKQSEKLKANIVMGEEEETGNTLSNMLENMFSKKTINNDRYKNIYMDIELDNIEINNNLAQYAEVDDINILGGTLDSTLSIDLFENKNIIKGNVDVENASVRYIDFDKNIENISGKIVLDDNNIDIVSDANVDKAKIHALLDINGKDIDISTEAKELDIQNIFKYKALKDIELDVSGKVDANVNVQINNGKLKNTKVDIVPNISVYDIPINNGDIKINLEDNKVDINGYISTNKDKVDIKGNIDIDKKIHNYTAHSDNIDITRLLKDNKNDIRGAVDINIAGKDNKFTGDFSAYSNYGKYILEYEKLNVKGKINDLLSKNIDITAKIDEIWAGYQRFKDIKTDIILEDNLVKIENFENENLDISGGYNISDKKLSLNGYLQDYTLYNTSSLSANVLVDKAEVVVDGSLDNLTGKVKLENSPVFMSKKYIGDIMAELSLQDNIVSINNAKIRESSLSGTYNMKDDDLDIKLHINDNSILEMLNIADANIHIDTNLALTGKLNDFDLSGKMNISEISYKDIELPNVFIDVAYTDGSVDKLLKKGMVELKDFQLIDREGKLLYSVNDKFDLENLNINYALNNAEINLEDIKLLKEKGYNGKIILNTIVNGTKDDIFASITAESDKLTLAGNTLESILVNIEANKKQMNITQIYLEYQDNPLLIDGYISFEDMQYSIKGLAEKFDINFLKFNPSIKTVNGLIDANFEITNKNNSGDIKISNLNLSTKDKLLNIKNTNIDIGLASRIVDIKKFSGNINGGILDIKGTIETPVLATDFIKTRNIKLGAVNIDGYAKDIDVKYKNIFNANISSELHLKNNNLDGNITIDGGKVRRIPGKSRKEDTANIKPSFVTELKNDILNNMLKQYSANLTIEIQKPIKINIDNYLVVNNIVGDVVGGGTLTLRDANINFIGEAEVSNGGFVLNKRNFKIEDAIVKLTDPLNSISEVDPELIFRANTDIEGENIEISMIGPLSIANLSMKSSTGLSRDEILRLLAFESETGKEIQKSETNVGSIKVDTGFKGSTLLNTAVNTTLDNFLFNPISSGLKNVLGVNNINIKTNFAGKENQTIDSAWKNSTTTLYVQDYIFNNKQFTWNAELTIPLTLAKDAGMMYKLWLNYSLIEGLGWQVGIASRDTALNNNLLDRKSINVYTSIELSKKYDNTSDFFKGIYNRTLKRTKLKGTEIKEQRIDIGKNIEEYFDNLIKKYK